MDIGSSVRCFLAPNWVLGMAALQQLTSDPAFLPVCAFSWLESNNTTNFPVSVQEISYL